LFDLAHDLAVVPLLTSLDLGSDDERLVGPLTSEKKGLERKVVDEVVPRVPQRVRLSNYV
jgi:hypothetical protein